MIEYMIYGYVYIYIYIWFVCLLQRSFWGLFRYSTCSKPARSDPKQNLQLDKCTNSRRNRGWCDLWKRQLMLMTSDPPLPKAPAPALPRAVRPSAPPSHWPWGTWEASTSRPPRRHPRSFPWLQWPPLPCRSASRQPTSALSLEIWRFLWF